jgi:hypothetical protein
MTGTREDDSVPQDPNAYYYAPMKEGGTFQKIGEDTSRFLLAAALVQFGGSDPARATNTAMRGVGNVVADIGGSLGQIIDNLDTISKNLNTLMTELNDPQSWMSPMDGDD